jgi:hypothetical protein
MRIASFIPCVAMGALLAACTPSEYYDANGNYIPRQNANLESDIKHAPDPGAIHADYNDPRVTRTVTTYNYDRPGYYDYNGYYIAQGPAVPQDMFPPRGLCRVWFSDRNAQTQPGIESCDGIRQRVPAGAYVIYGG